VRHELLAKKGSRGVVKKAGTKSTKPAAKKPAPKAAAKKAR
jgi:hypothetical protein